ncbi:hypothetical protein AB751O23_AC_00280 [Chlamydiales bacterium SCGC AB-751-O23]|jgi:hypothetical protein|nr:hypothetical protein AB751O23_AC_00280 [Chlamydiales bacterium SCGC AB-751-O23]
MSSPEKVNSAIDPVTKDVTSNSINKAISESFSSFKGRVYLNLTSYSQSVIKTIGMFSSLYYTGKMCQKSSSLRRSLTKGALISSYVYLSKSDPISGALSFSTTVLGAMQTDSEKEINLLTRHLLDQANSSFSQNEFVGEALANFSRFVDLTLKRSKKEELLPILLGLSAGSLISHSILNLPEGFRDSLEEPLKKLGTITSILSGSLLGGQVLNTTAYRQVKRQLKTPLVTS